MHTLLIPKSQIRLSSEVLSAFESAVRQILKKINVTSDEKNKLTKANSNDTCFRCYKQGHWASECPEGHQPEWLAKQKCFLCGQQGHSRMACPKKIRNDKLKTKIIQNKP